MSLIKKPNEIEPKRTISALIYGVPGSGKTSIACSAPNPVLIDTDGGVQRVNIAHRVPTVQVTCWEDVIGNPNGRTEEEKMGAIKAIAAMEKAGEIKCETIIFDTAGRTLDFMSDYIIRHDPKMGMRDGSLSLKGYGVRKNMFINLISQLRVMGKNIIFVAHEKEEKQGEFTVKRPEIGGSSANDLIRELDLVGYMKMIGKKRAIFFDPNEEYYAKNCCNLKDGDEIPVVVDENGIAVGKNEYFTNVINSFIDFQKKTMESAAEYTELVKSIDEVVAEAKDCDGLNKVLQSVQNMKHIFNSKLLAAQKLASRAAELNCKYDKLAKCYVAV